MIGPSTPARFASGPGSRDLDQKIEEYAFYCSRGRCRTGASEIYLFQVADRDYSIRYARLTHVEGHGNAPLTCFTATRAFEVSFRLEGCTLPDGSFLSGYGSTGTGHAFQVLGGVANGLLDWAHAHEADYLHFVAQDTRRQRLYDRMVGYFAARGSGWYRRAAAPFGGMPCRPEHFWLECDHKVPRV